MAVIFIVALVLSAAWFIGAGERFQVVDLVCYGFWVGWLSALVAVSVYRKS